MSSLYIGDSWSEGHGEQFVSTNPYNGEELWVGNSASSKDVEKAIKTARAALASWSFAPIDKRVAILNTFKALLEKRADEFAELISEEMGKPLWEASTEVRAMLGKVPASIKAFEERCGIREIDLDTVSSITRFRPHGVVAVFGPFNFPGHLPNGHIVPALLAGNTVVFKPSEQTPRVGEKLVELWRAAGLPSGVLNLVQGAKDTGLALSKSRGIDGLYFTGSSETGRAIHRQFAGNPGCVLALEMGGNNPLIVWDVEDEQAAAFMAVQSSFITSGQRCTCARRLIIQKDDDEFLDRFVEMAGNLIVGAYNDEDEPFMGPVVSEAAGNQVFDSYNKLLDAGANSILEMEVLEEKANLLTPGIIDVTEMPINCDQEIFGPLVQVTKVETIEDAIDVANRTKYGLSASIISPSRKHFQLLFQKSRAGIINWNRQTTGASGLAPFGGTGLSGNHRPSGFFAADYTAYPVASIECDEISLPDEIPPGVILEDE